MVKRKDDSFFIIPSVITLFAIIETAAFITISILGIKAQSKRDEYAQEGIWQHVMLYVCSFVCIVFIHASVFFFAGNYYFRVGGVLLSCICGILLIIFGICTAAGYATFNYEYTETLVKNRIDYERNNKCCHIYDKSDEKQSDPKYWVQTFRDCPFINEVKEKEIQGFIRIDNSTCKKEGATEYCNVIEEDEKISLFCNNVIDNDKVFLLILMILEFVFGVVEFGVMIISVYLYLPAFKALYNHLKGIQKTESIDSDDEINHIDEEKDVKMGE